MSKSRIDNPTLRERVMSAEQAATLIDSGSTIGMSGFTGSGYPKAVPLALAARIEAEHAAGNPFRVRIWTGASTGPELDGALAKADGIEFRLPVSIEDLHRQVLQQGQEVLQFEAGGILVSQNSVHRIIRESIYQLRSRN